MNNIAQFRQSVMEKMISQINQAEWNKGAYTAPLF